MSHSDTPAVGHVFAALFIANRGAIERIPALYHRPFLTMNRAVSGTAPIEGSTRIPYHAPPFGGTRRAP